MRTLRITFLALVGVLSLAACGNSDDGGQAAVTTTTASGSTTAVAGDGTPPAGCSAAALSEDLPEAAGVPAVVATTRKAIVEAAVACDFQGLERLALAGDGTFQYSFGQDSPEGSAQFWEEREAEGEPVLAFMVKVLGLPHATRSDGSPTFYSWPSADKEQRSEADWKALEAIYPKEEIAEWRASDLYTGFRLGITSEGDWVSFVAGD